MLTPKDHKFLESQGDAVHSPLGKGVYGIVVLTERKGKQYAVKLSTNWRTHLQEELTLRSLGSHPNIVTFHSSWSKGQLHALRMEYVPGRSLLSILEEHPLSESQAHTLFLQLVYGVYHAHESQRIVHRDLKAENLILSPDGSKLTIVDWGMGMEWAKDRPCLQTCGSPDYAAPEIFQKKPYFGPEVDIWSMGVILYAMVTDRYNLGEDCNDRT